MYNKLKSDAAAIYNAAISESLPDKAVQRALKELCISEDVILVSIGKAAWRMAKAAYGELGSQIKSGIVITKYGHSQGPIANFKIYEAGHPILDENGIEATKAALDLVAKEKDNRKRAVLFLVSGGGSALFESLMPGITLDYMRELNAKLLASGAEIHEINTIRKLFSEVKGGRFAEFCAPAKVYQIVLSDVLGDDLGSIASGPAAPNHATTDDVRNLNKKYSLGIDEEILAGQHPTETSNVTTIIAANVTILCQSAANKAKELGYAPVNKDNAVSGDVEQLADKIYSDAINTKAEERPCALIYGGEPTVHIKGNGLGGRNQELALLIAKKIAGIGEMTFVSCGSDGTDGPTDAAGGITDGSTWEQIAQKGLDPASLLANNDSNRALAAADALIITGPTGTNVNDLIFMLLK